jgi:hypothetical protein
MNTNIREFTLAVPTKQDMINAINALKALGLKPTCNSSELEFGRDAVLRHGHPRSLNYFWMSGLGAERGNHYTNLGDLVVYLTTPVKTERQKRIEDLELTRIPILQRELAELKAQENA